MVALEDADAGELESMAKEETLRIITHCCGSLQKLLKHAGAWRLFGNPFDAIFDLLVQLLQLLDIFLRGFPITASVHF